MITKKTPQEIALLREGGKRLAYILRMVAESVSPGVSTFALTFAANIATGPAQLEFLIGLSLPSYQICLE